MSDQSATNRAAIYVRDMSDDGPNQVNLIGQPRPVELHSIAGVVALVLRPRLQTVPGLLGRCRGLLA